MQDNNNKITFRIGDVVRKVKGPYHPYIGRVEIIRPNVYGGSTIMGTVTDCETGGVLMGGQKFADDADNYVLVEAPKNKADDSIRHRLKVGDIVDLKDSYLQRVIDNAPTMYNWVGQLSPGEETQLLTIFASREYDEPLRGTVERLSEDDPNTPTAYVIFSNKYGECAGYFKETNVEKVGVCQKCRCTADG